MLKILPIYEQGTVHDHDREDLLLLPSLFQEPMIFGVLDGVSAPYVGEPVRYEGKTGGQVVCQIVSETIHRYGPGLPLTPLLAKANIFIRRFAKANGLDLLRSDLLPGATFALARITTAAIEIIQGGDCLIVWQYTDERIGTTINQAYRHELELRMRFAELLAKHQGNRLETWQEFIPVLSQLRRERVNQKWNGYALLNGQPAVAKRWEHRFLDRKNVARILLLTDGLYEPYFMPNDSHLVGRRIITLYESGGLVAVLANSRAAEELEKSSHIGQAEATGIAIEL